MVKVSLVVPVYGVEKYIGTFLKSISAQTFQDIEVILVDDGSPDNCPSILDEFASRDARYHVIHQKNGGVSVARNTGLAHAIGEYVYIVDSDDWLDERAVEKLYEAAVQTGADLVYGDWYGETDDGVSQRYYCFPQEFVADDPDTLQALQCGIFTNSNRCKIHSRYFDKVNYFGGAPWRGMIRLSLIKDNNIAFDPYVRGIGDDVIFMLHVYEYVRKAAYIQYPIYHYRTVAGSYTHGYKANFLESIDRTFSRMEDFLNKYNKNETVRCFYYYRVLLYLNQGIDRYFLNANNPKKDSERFAEFKRTLNSEPYRTAIRKARINTVYSKKRRYGYMLLRLKQYRLYWMLRKHALK